MIKKERRIPTIFGLLIVLMGIGTTAFLVEHFQNVRIQAQPSFVPREVKITNLSSGGVTISWMTAEKTQGFVNFGEEEPLEKNAFDERDEERKLNKYFTHHVNVKNLKPASTYYFKIISKSKSFDQNGLPYEVRTAPLFSTSPSEVEPAYGAVLNRDNTPAQGAIVYLTFKGALPLSGLTRPSGNFLIPLNLAISSDFKGYFIPQEKEQEEIVVRASVDEMATVITDTKNDSPIPTIILGKSYDFRSQKAEQIKPLAKERSPQKVLGAKENAGEIEILFPKEGAALLDPKPLFRGEGIPRNEVIVKIESPLLVEKTVVDPNGQWSFRPKVALPPGKHTLTVTTKDEEGKETTLSRTFLVLKSGTQVLGEATPSATLTPTPLLTATPTPLTLTPTPTPLPLTPTPSIIPGILAPTTNFLLLGTLLFLIGTGLTFVL